MEDLTAMQQLIEIMKEQCLDVSDCIYQAEKLLEVEKKNIVDGFEDGFKDNSTESNPKYRDGEHYYSTKFNNQK